MKLKTFFPLFITYSIFTVFFNQGLAQEKTTNIALGMQVQASSELAEYPASNIVDGKITRIGRAHV